MKIKRSLRELKFIAAQMNEYTPLLEAAIFAFQDPRLVEIVGRITGLRELEPDEQLYAGGISMMVEGHFLNPHIDNLHDKARDRYRVLNLLYYVSPDWSLANGGNLELWPEGPQGEQITIESRFNRLAVMITHKTSWHSVSQVRVPQSRSCVSNCYFSKNSQEESEYFHVTSFRGRPEQKLRDLVLRDYKVRILESGAGTNSRTRVLIESGDGRAVWGTVGVSDNIIDASWEALRDAVEYKLSRSRPTPGSAG
jgi:hypothetical protein